MVDVVCVVGGEGGYLPSASDWEVWHGTPLEVVSDNHSHAPIYVMQWDIVVLDRHVVLLVLAALLLYVKWGAWHTPDARGEWPL